MLVLLRLITRDMRIAVVIFVPILAFRYDPFWFAMIISSLEMGLTAFLFLRVGLLSVVTMHFIRLLLEFPIAAELGQWHAVIGWSAFGLVATLALTGAMVCRPPPQRHPLRSP